MVWGAGRDPGQYRQRARTLLFNLRDANNPQLRGRVVTRDLSAAVLVQMSSEDLASKVLNFELPMYRLASWESVCEWVIWCSSSGRSLLSSGFCATCRS